MNWSWIHTYTGPVRLVFYQKQSYSERSTSSSSDLNISTTSARAIEQWVYAPHAYCSINYLWRPFTTSFSFFHELKRKIYNIPGGTASGSCFVHATDHSILSRPPLLYYRHHHHRSFLANSRPCTIAFLLARKCLNGTAIQPQLLAQNSSLWNSLIKAILICASHCMMRRKNSNRAQNFQFSGTTF